MADSNLAVAQGESQSDEIRRMLLRCRGKCALALITLTNRSTLVGGIDDASVTAQFQEHSEILLRDGDSLSALDKDHLVVIFDNLIDIHHLHLAGLKFKRIFEHPLYVGKHSVRFEAFCSMLYLAGDADPTQVESYLDLAEEAWLSGHADPDHNEPFAINTIEDESKVENHWLIGARLRDALTAHDIYLDYQPKVILDSGAISGAQALARWRDNGAVVPENEYLPALQPDLQWELAVYCLRKIIRDIQDYDHAIPIWFTLQSGLLKEPDLVPFLERETSLWGIEPRQLVLSVNDRNGLLMDGEQRHVLEALRQRGFRLAISGITANADADFLKSLRADAIQLDASMASALQDGSADVEFVRHLFGMMQTAGTQCVALGVEDAQTAQWLCEAGCELGQGFYLSAPISLDQLISFAQ